MTYDLKEQIRNELSMNIDDYEKTNDEAKCMLYMTVALGVLPQDAYDLICNKLDIMLRKARHSTGIANNILTNMEVVGEGIRDSHLPVPHIHPNSLKVLPSSSTGSL